MTVLSAAALKKRLLERQTASPASSVSPEGIGKTIDDSDKASGENPGAGDKVSGAFERLLLEGAEIPAGGDGYVKYAAIPKAKYNPDIDCEHQVCRPQSLLRSLLSERWSSYHLSSPLRATSRSKPMVLLF